MTLEELIRIVVETVERVIKLNRIKIIAYVFDQANVVETLEAAGVINGSAQLLSPKFDSSPTHDCGDILFLDYIPIEYLPKLALGICDNSLCRLINSMIASGKPIYVLKKSPEMSQKSSAAFKALLDTYSSLLKNYGFIFLEPEDTPECADSTPYHFTGNVLSLKELQNCSAGGKIIVEPKCVITTLAAETAKNMNVTIIRQV
jgi:hypothetical protein